MELFAALAARLLPGFLVLALATTGCASLNPKYSYQGMGAADFQRDRKVVEKIDDAQVAPTPEKVTVLLDTLPDGVVLKDGIFQIAPGYEHQILGKLEVAPNGHVSLIAL